jgi:hypothetical protein
MNRWLLGCLVAVATLGTNASRAVSQAWGGSSDDRRAPAGVDTIFILPGSHLDIGYTAPPSRVRQARVQYIEDAIAAARHDTDFHWFEESGWSFDAWLRRYGHDEKRMAAVRQLLQRGQIGVGASWVTPHAAAFPDALRFLTLHVDELDRQFGYRPTVAVLNDPPSYPEALADALAEHGVRYVLVGANMFLTPPFPAELVRTPFWWETARGNRLLVYIDPDGFTAAFNKWGLGPRCAQAFNAKRFPQNRGEMETMQDGIRAGLRDVPATYHALIVQQALDNWDTDCANELPGAVRAWNKRGDLPQLVIAQPEAYFRHIQDRYGPALPVWRGEWGGHWDELRSANPVWTWRLREAARQLRTDAPRDARAAIATALDHNLALGGAREGMTERDCRQHIRETAGIFERAVRLAAGPRALTAQPADPELESTPISAALSAVFASASPVRVRAGPRDLWFVRPDAAVSRMPIRIGSHSDHFAARAEIDRRSLVGENVVIEVALRGARGGFRLAPDASPDAVAGRWLAGEPPFVIAPAALRVIGSRFLLKVTSDVVFTWTLTPDPRAPDVTWLQGLVARQSDGCVLEGGRKVALPFEVLYPGEPANLVVHLDVSVLH